MSKKKIPGSREEDSWFSEEQLDQLESAEDDRRQLPIPTQMVSNGEYMPNPQTEAQRRGEGRLLELATEGPKKIRGGPRQVLTSSAAAATAFPPQKEGRGAEGVE